MDTLEHLEKELEALLWICFSSRYLFLIFKEKIFFQLFFVENFLVAKNSLPIFSGIPFDPYKRYPRVQQNWTEVPPRRRASRNINITT